MKSGKCMYKLEFRTRAYKNIQDISKFYNQDLPIIDQWFSDLQQKWINTTNIKEIWRIKWDLIYRKRVGRRRIVFMINWVSLDIFLIELEKSTSKDYNDRLDYVKKSLK
mgnify:CR=1 FL=1